MKKRGINRASIMAEGIRGMEYVDCFLNGEEDFTADGAAQALLDGYAGLCLLEQQYKAKFSTNVHYTKDDAYYLMTQGAHEETERVQTSGPSDGVARAVANVDSFLARLNREADEEFRASVVEPYMRVTEMKRLFEFSLKLMEPQTAAVATQLYGHKTGRSRICDSKGTPMTKAAVAKAEKGILNTVEFVLKNYRESSSSKGMNSRKQYAADVITSQMPECIARPVREYMADHQAQPEMEPQPAASQSGTLAAAD